MYLPPTNPPLPAKSKCSSAFTLIELSIVLVIIGLVVGGVLVGQDLIRAAELRKFYSEAQSIERAAVVFKLKYNCIAGDCGNATQFFGTDASCPDTPSNTVVKTATCNGNSDGVVGGYDPSTGSSLAAGRYEWARFWQHLGNAELIPHRFTGTGGVGAYFDTRNTVHYPESSLGGRYYLYFFGSTGNANTFSMPAAHWLALGEPDPANNGGPFKGVISPMDAKQLDSKYDDGVPVSGRTMASTRDYVYSTNCTTTNASDSVYDITQMDKKCRMFLQLKF